MFDYGQGQFSLMLSLSLSLPFSVSLFLILSPTHPPSLSRALESDQYNHITATYFLLAERILREKQEREQNNHTWSSPSHKAQFRYSKYKHTHSHTTQNVVGCVSVSLHCTQPGGGLSQ